MAGSVSASVDREPRTADIYSRGLAAWDAGDLETAERSFRFVLARRPRHADAMHHLGLVAQSTGRLRLASRLLEASSRARPQNAAYAFNLGNLRFQQGRHAAALREWERAARLDPRDEDAWRNIGRTCAERGWLARAEEAFLEALAIDDAAADTCAHLASVARRAGRPDEGREWAARALRLASDPDALIRFAGARAGMGRLEEALTALRRAIRLRPSDAESHFRLAELLAHRGRERAARRACGRALVLDPSHAGAAFLADALRGRTPRTPPRERLAALFDQFADTFDVTLVEHLAYQGPELLWSAVQRVFAKDGRRATRLRVLDAGCGTGLAARLLRPAASRLVGIDLSARMLAKARERGGYDCLLPGDLVEHLRAIPAGYDLIFAADVFIYVGDLGLVIAAARRALRPGGLLAFSVERCDGASYCLSRALRYAHSIRYVRGLARANRLAIRETRTATLRYERGLPVSAGIIVLQAC